MRPLSCIYSGTHDQFRGHNYAPEAIRTAIAVLDEHGAVAHLHGAVGAAAVATISHDAVVLLVDECQRSAQVAEAIPAGLVCLAGIGLVAHLTAP